MSQSTPYFGQAFFAEAMRNEASLEKAFIAAKKRIRAMEREQGYDPSEPQMRVGRNIAVMLPQFEARLFPPSPLAVSSPTVSSQGQGVFP
jgi:hypothetical protein